MSALLVGLSESPSPVYYEQVPPDEAFKQMGLHETEFGSWTGFFDWLRTERGNVIGVRYWPFENTEFLLRLVSGAPFEIDPAGALLIFLSSNRCFDQTLSDDQSFEEARLFSASGTYSILFGCSNLTVEERAALKDLAQHREFDAEVKGPPLN